MLPQEKELMAASLSLVSISQVASLTPYSAGYLSLLARKGKFSAVKINRDWLTTQQAVLFYVKKQETKHKKTLNGLVLKERGSHES